jgi:hypothetical protein
VKVSNTSLDIQVICLMENWLTSYRITSTICIFILNFYATVFDRMLFCDIHKNQDYKGNTICIFGKK